MSFNKLWAIPIISLLLLIIVGFTIQGNVDSGIDNNKKAITLSDVKSSIEENYGYYTGSVTGVLTSTKEFTGLHVEIEYYDFNNNKIDTQSSALTQNNVIAKQGYKIDGSYWNKEQPSKAIIKVYDNTFGGNVIHSQELAL
jgi:hypothetical protein